MKTSYSRVPSKLYTPNCHSPFIFQPSVAYAPQHNKLWPQYVYRTPTLEKVQMKHFMTTKTIQKLSYKTLRKKLLQKFCALHEHSHPELVGVRVVTVYTPIFVNIHWLAYRLRAHYIAVCFPTAAESNDNCLFQ